MMDWNECNFKKLVKRVKEDKSLIKSLIESSQRKLKTNERIELDETTASTKLSIIYDAVREVLEAIAVKKGFKIYNHECFVSFLSEVCNEKSLSASFDKFRRLRNQINYYGKNVEVPECRQLIKELLSLKYDLIKLFNDTK